MSPTKRAAVGCVTLAAAVAAVYFGAPFRAQFTANQGCCRLPFARNLLVTTNELLARARYPSQVGQDKWVLEAMFPGVTDGYFLDVGSGHGTFHSNTEGAELDALRAFPFDRIRLGSLAIEHNYEEPKRSQVVDVLARHGYQRVHSVRQDDFFAPVSSR